MFGSHDIRVAEFGADLFLQEWAPLIVFSGGLGRLTKGLWKNTEADEFAELAIKMGVPKSAILIENKSTNSGENVILTQQILNDHNLNPQSFILVHKPYMERRCYATFKKLLPDKKIVVTSPKITFEDYSNQLIKLEEVINIMVGDLQRIKVYSQTGFQIYQEIPADVCQSYEKLVKLGYTEHLIN